MTTPEPPAKPEKTREVRLGDQQCPRCHETFTISYWSESELIQARCLSCELKWPLPRVV
jgi:Zn ribbon nucleic-acid-binding protein